MKGGILPVIKAVSYLYMYGTVLPLFGRTESALHLAMTGKVNAHPTSIITMSVTMSSK